MSSSFYRAVDRGLWNPLEVFLASIWWLGTGWVIRHERAALGVLTLLLGFSSLIDAAGRILGLEILYQVGVGGIFILLPVWALWFGIDLLRQPVLGSDRLEAGGRLSLGAD